MTRPYASTDVSVISLNGMLDGVWLFAGVAKDYGPPVETQDLKAMRAEEDWHIPADYGRESENLKVAADGPQVQSSTACLIFDMAIT